jgi:geranylgeranyl diphosphate synthase type 3
MSDSDSEKTGKHLAQTIVSSILTRPPEDLPWSPAQEKVPICPCGDARTDRQMVTDPYLYLHAKPGKDIRTQMISSFNVWLQLPTRELQVITRVVGMLHTSSLLYPPPQL